MSELPGQILLQCILIALNAFFAASEIAVISLSSNKLRAQAEDGDKTAAKMLILVDEPTGFLSTIQIGITLAGFLGSAFAAENFAGLLTDWLVNGVGVTAISPSVINTVSVVVVTLILSLFCYHLLHCHSNTSVHFSEFRHFYKHHTAHCELPCHAFCCKGP